MDSMEYNKIAAAVLTAGIAFAGFGIIADNLSHPRAADPHGARHQGRRAGRCYSTPRRTGAEADRAAAGQRQPGGRRSLHTHKICVACHNFKEGAGAKVGPDLYGVVGREQASAPGFEYSSALKAHHGQMDLRHSERLALQARRLRQRHQDGLRRPVRRQAARRPSSTICAPSRPALNRCRRRTR